MGRFLFLVAGVGFEPHDLQVMSLASYRTALPRVQDGLYYTTFGLLCQEGIFFSCVFCLFGL